MKYKKIKKFIDLLYITIQGIHDERLKSSLYDGLMYCGKNTEISLPNVVTTPSRVSVGSNTTILANSRMQVYDKGNIYIGDDCYIGYHFTILAGGGRQDW